jgi:serine/threonine protein kinase
VADGEQFGPYVVYEQIGAGGMASVHRAETHGLAGFRRPVALKRMLPGVEGNAELVQAFIREARLASHLRHENVAQTYELGKVGDTYFIAMELVPGRNLREILKHCAGVCGAMPLPLALNIASQILDALDYAHNLCDDSGQPLGIIHRDVSPANVIVSEGGVVKLIDFGIAKVSGQGMQSQSRTIKGKFGYMAPEYLDGRIDSRADLFAAGVITHELLANRPLFQGRDEMQTLLNVREMEIPPPSHWRPEIPPPIEHIVMTALQRDPDQRWQRATAMRAALATELKHQNMVSVSSQLVEWLARAFANGPDIDHEPEISIQTGTVTFGSVPPMPPRPPDDATKTLLFRPSRPEAIPPEPVPVPVPAAAALRPLATWLSALLVLGISGTVAAVIYFGLLYVT